MTKKEAERPKKRVEQSTPTQKVAPTQVTKPLVEKPKEQEVILEYSYKSKNMPINIRIYKTEGEFIPIYEVSIATISRTTEIILEKIRQELIKQVRLGMVDLTDTKKAGLVEERFSDTIGDLINRYFPDIDDQHKGFLTTYLIQRALGMGRIEILMDDKQLEEVAINSSDEPVWVYHQKTGWLKTNITVEDEDQTRHYATMIGRKVGRQISILDPLLDAHLNEGDRVNATLMPISTFGNSITLRKFSRDPWTITSFLKFKTLSIEAAALIWTAIQYELSALVVGGTASGKTSMLNVVSNFFPPTQRVISIEDTREIRLPKYQHWLAMSTRTANAEGRGEVSMLDLLVNSLRQRPDRIIVGEVRRKREAETLFEAIHTGHSVYATFHANTAEEAVTRLTNPPIEVPKIMLPAISMLLVQYRNRRTGMRRTFQLAEVLPDGNSNVILQYDAKRDNMLAANKSKALMDTLELFTGHTQKELNSELKEKVQLLKIMVQKNIEGIDDVGLVMAHYYTNKEKLFKELKTNKFKIGD
ncbi:type II/IV secretion system ATPase subunit [Candidatus Woesearchaeota archaeon]|nr:type II/IV secretion system ATPase subunit [Candidatus Woesearchaeota archaeon]